MLYIHYAMDKFHKIFRKSNKVLIGAIHFPPLLGYPDFPGFDIALENALSDLKALEDGGADAVILENNYDIPHTEFVGSGTVTSMAFLAGKIKEVAKIPVGISVLWNDYKTALCIAKALGLKFVRVPVFIDTVKTDYGIISGVSKDIINFRKSIKAEKVAIFTDIHVKHAELISRQDIVESANKAIKEGSDAIIVTGKWTGDAPNMDELKKVRKATGNFPILCGSGVDEKNVAKLFTMANGAIVSTSLKEGVIDKKEVNVKPYSARIDIDLVKNLVETAKGGR